MIDAAFSPPVSGALPPPLTSTHPASVSFDPTTPFFIGPFFFFFGKQRDLSFWGGGLSPLSFFRLHGQEI